MVATLDEIAVTDIVVHLYVRQLLASPRGYLDAIPDIVAERVAVGVNDVAGLYYEEPSMAVGSIYNAIFSPDGGKVAYSMRESDFEGGIYTINLDGTGKERLTSGFFPNWGPKPVARTSR
jgi:hypothetical protein